MARVTKRTETQSTLEILANETELSQVCDELYVNSIFAQAFNKATTICSPLSSIQSTGVLSRAKQSRMNINITSIEPKLGEVWSEIV